MPTNFYPTFQKGRILKLEMLEQLRDYPRHLMDIYYQDYSDGIITGANVIVNENSSLTVTKGIVKLHGHLYYIEQDQKIGYEISGNETIIKMRFHPEKKEKDFIKYQTELLLDENTEILPNELELARYKLKKGARLRSDYQNFEDFSTEFNTLNVIHTPYAGIGQSTIHPIIQRYFAKEVLRLGGKVMEDMMIAMLCLNNESVEREVYLYYLANRFSLDYKDYSNLQIHRFLVRILQELMGGSPTRSTMGGTGRKRILVD
ncbi:DNA and RNA helicase [Fredinandcohnia quinoae]|uniref:DNA and RNA helicase n=1 Tax=Fredinandcohnia quinoae TaxID=2918902 RepID=A0AAW5E8M1_9BACI|nr:DNA and RNA helicase [Fredinandcohnia sp. SECRCQ15]MCH1625990.1 DNA and RNA helicase [Fredinandcohnia sp. SECRCQ15]